MDISEQKKRARAAGFSRRKISHANKGDAAERAAEHMLEYITHAGNPAIISAYMPIRTEMDPMPVMQELHARGHRIVVPVIVARGKPLLFREWTPGADMIVGPFGAEIPRNGARLDPDFLIVPLAAFDLSGGRIGYGGGFYDRSIALLRAKKPTQAVGYAFAAQQGEVPTEDTDQMLDAVVTESGTFRF